MTKRNPIAATLAQPQHRQRVIDRRALRDKISEQFAASLAYLADAEHDDTRQADSWQEPTRQPDEEL